MQQPRGETGGRWSSRSLLGIPQPTSGANVREQLFAGPHPRSFALILEKPERPQALGLWLQSSWVLLSPLLIMGLLLQGEKVEELKEV